MLLVVRPAYMTSHTRTCYSETFKESCTKCPVPGAIRSRRQSQPPDGVLRSGQRAKTCVPPTGYSGPAKEIRSNRIPWGVGYPIGPGRAAIRMAGDMLAASKHGAVMQFSAMGSLFFSLTICPSMDRAIWSSVPNQPSQNPKTDPQRRFGLLSGRRLSENRRVTPQINVTCRSVVGPSGSHPLS